MQLKLPFGAGAKLDALGTAITSGTLKTYLLQLLLGMVFVAMLWPYLLELSESLRQALARMMGGQRERRAVLRALADSAASRGQQGGPKPTEAMRGGGRKPAGSDQAVNVTPLPLPGQQSSEIGPRQSPEIAPLTTLEALLGYEGPGRGRGFAPFRRPFVPRSFPPLRNRLLVCHDLAGGYGEDRFVQGGGYDRAYRMYDWGLVDIFVYFSHNLVTIPPAGWTDVAHRHGTRVLGTFITEWEAGHGICAELLRSEETAERAAAQLTRIAVDHGFDGWLVNIENKVDPGAGVDHLVHFVRSLTLQMRAAKGHAAEAVGTEEGQGGASSSSYFPPLPASWRSRRNSASTVLWYDSVTKDGELAWQDRLNEKNRAFFDASDGIFVNYTWGPDYPSASALEAKERRYDVYMGIDTFGRGTWGGGGLDVDKALGSIRRAGVSAALFAPSWTMENMTPGSGKVAPGEDWQAVERGFGNVDEAFWAKIAATWVPPRPVPGPAGAALPLVVNFGNGVGDAWRVRGQEVAVFRGDESVLHGNGAFSSKEKRLVVGGAFYDLASQCITPLIGGRGSVGLNSNSAMGRRAGSNAPPLSANGMVGAKYSFTESFDGGSCLRFTGVLNEKVTASFPLFSCDMRLPAEPLEVRLTFCGNPDSEVALVLVLDVQGQLGERREVVLRDWGHEGVPANQPVFSKRLSLTEERTTYSPVEEVLSGEFSAGNAENSWGAAEDLQARVSVLRGIGKSYDTIRDCLCAQRGSDGNGGSGGGGGGGIPPASPTSTTNSSSSAAWTTRKYVLRDLRLGGSYAIRDVRVVCARRTVKPAEDREGGGGLQHFGGRSLRAGGGGVGGREGGLRGVAGFAAFRACLGEVAIGPWRKDMPLEFQKLKGLRAVEVACVHGGGGGGDDEEEAGVVVDLSLEWESSPGIPKRRKNFAGGALGESSRYSTLHCDVWQASEEAGQGGGSGGGWRWLGRAYGRKYRLSGLRARASVEGEAAIVLAVQQVNAMGYREPVKDWARLQLRLP